MTKTIRTHDHWVTWCALYHFASQTSRGTFSLHRQLKVFFFEKLRSNLKRVRFKFLKMQILPLKALLCPFQFCVCNRLLLTSALRWQLFCSFYSIRKKRPTPPQFRSSLDSKLTASCSIWATHLQDNKNMDQFIRMALAGPWNLRSFIEDFAGVICLNLLWLKFARSWVSELSKVTS